LIKEENKLLKQISPKISYSMNSAAKKILESDLIDKKNNFKFISGGGYITEGNYYENLENVLYLEIIIKISGVNTISYYLEDILIELINNKTIIENLENKIVWETLDSYEFSIDDVENFSKLVRDEIHMLIFLSTFVKHN